ncbi:MAG: 16S rRNA (guanine(527)-N(7))-methyltransferase RsmG [Rhodanobacteraceae bacterium]
MEASLALAHKLRAGLATLDVAVAGDAQARLIAYVDLLAHWNRAYNLTAVRVPADMVARHLLDSLAILPHVHGTTLADLGSGAGLPGIPLAVASPDVSVTLIESNGKKARFLREAARSLPLPNVRIEQVRVQAAVGAFDTVTSRAFAGLGDMLAWGGHLLAPDGRWLAMKGRVDRDELAAAAPAFRVVAVHPLSVPDIAAERNLVVLARAAAVGSR